LKISTQIKEKKKQQRKGIFKKNQKDTLKKIQKKAKEKEKNK
jgi:hypothetical protein